MRLLTIELVKSYNVRSVSDLEEWNESEYPKSEFSSGKSLSSTIPLEQQKDTFTNCELDDWKEEELIE